MSRSLFAGLLLGFFISPNQYASAAPPKAKASPACKYEQNCQCAAPGITLRWKAAACMWTNETDDFESGGVQSCLHQEDPAELSGKSDCDKNLFWKRKICEGLAQKKVKKLEDCTSDKAFMPRIVEYGAGG